MRNCLFLSLLLLACQAPRDGGRDDARDEIRDGDGVDAPAENNRPAVTRIVYRQYYGGSHTFMMENLGGRDVVKLRSKPVPAGQVPISYVPDDVMERLLKEFRAADFNNYAGPRPPNPARFGVAELTVVAPNKRTSTMIRRKRPATDPNNDYQRETKSYARCMRAYLAVWNHHRPTLQATTSTGGFGTKRVER